MLEKLPDAVGHALRDQRAGLDQIAFSRVPLRTGTAAIDLRSLAFADHMPIPERYTADGAGTSPPLQWTGVPTSAATLALIVEDADSPTPHPLVHAIVVHILAGDGNLEEGAMNRDDEQATGFTVGRNSYLQTAWLPPDPPPGHGTHRYAFQLFALGPDAELSRTPGRDELIQALLDHGIASGCLIGTYERPDTTIEERSGVGLGLGTPAIE